MTGNVLIKNRTPSSDVPYLFGLPKQKTTLLRRTSVLRSKTLAEGEFTSPEHFNFLLESKKEVTTYVVTSFLERATRLARSTAVPRHAQRAPHAPLGRFLASLAPCSPLCPLEPKNRRFCAVQAFCEAKSWRRANSLRPSISNHPWVEPPAARETKNAPSGASQAFSLCENLGAQAIHLLVRC